MGRVLGQWRADEVIRSLPIIAGGSDDPVIEPQAIFVPQPATKCTLNGDVTGNNIHANFMCLDIGMQLGNPMQYAGMAPVRFFGGFGSPPPPNQYGPGGNPTTPNTYPFQTGDFFFDKGGSIYWFSGSGWIKAGAL